MWQKQFGALIGAGEGVDDCFRFFVMLGGEDVTAPHLGDAWGSGIGGAAETEQYCSFIRRETRETLIIIPDCGLIATQYAPSSRSITSSSQQHLWKP